MKYIVQVNGERLTVELDGVTATVAGERFDVGLERLEGTPIRLVRIGEAVHRVAVRRPAGAERGTYALDVDGFRYDVEALDERTRTIRDLSASGAASSGPAPLLAPMPGLVVRVNVQVGDQVTIGQSLVVVEAMKMENELRAGSPGVVTVVRAVAGTAVNKGNILVELGPLDS